MQGTILVRSYPLKSSGEIRYFWGCSRYPHCKHSVQDLVPDYRKAERDEQFRAEKQEEEEKKRQKAKKRKKTVVKVGDDSPDVKQEDEQGCSLPVPSLASPQAV